MSTETGGSAFPLPASWNPHSGNQNNSEEYGMSLRDYFAAKALQGYFANEVCPHRCDGSDVAEYCYRMADAMLAARSKP